MHHTSNFSSRFYLFKGRENSRKYGNVRIAVNFIILTHAIIFFFHAICNTENETDGEGSQLLPKTQSPNPLTTGMSTKLYHCYNCYNIMI